MNVLDVSLFIIAVVGVIALGIWKSLDEDTSGEKGEGFNFRNCFACQRFMKNCKKCLKDTNDNFVFEFSALPRN